MAVEDTDYIEGLDPTKPDGSSPKSEGDDHLRLLKIVLQHCFAGFVGNVLLAASEAQGATANDYVLTVSPSPSSYTANTVIIFQATHANTGAATVQITGLSAVSLVNPEGTDLRANALTADCVAMAVFDGTNFRLLAGNSQAIYDYVDQAQFQSALPSQASNAGKFLKTDGTNASWQSALQQVTVAPGSNIGPIYLPGGGVYEWNGTAYVQVYTKSSIGLGNVDNTSDANKPISTATQTALNAKANLSGASFTGDIAATRVISSGTVLAGSGSAIFSANGDITGGAWGGSLSTNLTNRFGTKVNVRGGLGGQGYIMNNSGNNIYLAYNGAGGITAQVDLTGYGTLWTSNNFDPNSKQPAGNYVRDFSGAQRVGFSWDNGGKLILWVDGVGYRQVLTGPL